MADKPGHDKMRSRGVESCALNRPFLTAILLAAIALAGIVTAAAQERRVPTAAEMRLSYAPVVQRVAPAVVNVYAAKVVQNRNPLFDDPIFRRFFGVPGRRRASRCSARSAPA